MVSPAEALEHYRAAERAYVDSTYPHFATDAVITREKQAQVETLHTELEHARSTYLDRLRQAGWAVPFHDWSERRQELA